MIPFLNLHKINDRFQKEFQSGFESFLKSGQYILGDQVSNFEGNYANYCGTKYCLGVGNGLDALILIFKAYIELGVLKTGDEIIVPANTFIASILAIKQVGLIPVLVEPDIKTYNISVTETQKHITAKTKAILVVHLYGLLADVEGINDIAIKNNLLIIEDAAQAHGATNNFGVKAGNLSHAAAFSFYPSKNLGALGDAGAIVSNDNDLMQMINKLRNYGASAKYVFDVVGVNSRLDELQAIFLNIKLKYLDDDNEKRRAVAKQYLSEINNKKLKLPFYNGSKNHVFYAFVVLLEDRQNFVDYLKSHNIQTLIHYPIPPHKQKAFANLNFKKLPVTETIHNNIVSLPISPVMENHEIDHVIKVINQY